MNLESLQAVIREFNTRGVRYVIAGGLAVSAHGYVRTTMDIDIAIDLVTDNVEATFRALASIGYQPIVPVTAQSLADPLERRRWISEKGMQVLNFFSDQHKATAVDIFVVEPFDFQTEYDGALVANIGADLQARFISIQSLILMKEAAGRPRDLDDAQHLRWIVAEQKPSE